MAKGTSGARKFVTGSVVNIAIIGGVILAAGYAAKKYNIGGNIIANLGGAGSAAGQSILAPIAGLIQGVNLGTQGLVGQLGQSQDALFNQLNSMTESWNKLFHPDWYNPDGSYSSKNPKFGQTTNSNASGSTVGKGGLTATGATTPTTATATQKSNGLPPPQNTNHIITTIKATTTLPGVGESTFARDVRTGTTVRGLPLNTTIQNMLQKNQPVQSTVINTIAGGTREVVGSPDLIARLKANLSSR